MPSSFVANLPVGLFAPQGIVVSYVPSGSVLTHLRELPPVKSKGLLAFGDPLYARDAEEEAAIPPGGVLVTHVLPNSNADEHGLKDQDVILAYDGTQLVTPADLVVRVTDGDTVPIQVWRDGKKVELDVSSGNLGIAVAPDSARNVILARQRLQRTGNSSVNFKPLPGTSLEVQRLVSRLKAAGEEGGIGFVGSVASEKTLFDFVVASRLKDYRFLHFAAHGVLNDQRPARSAIVLSQPPPPLQFGDRASVPDGYVTVEEIIEQWELTADLVVLSACDTALGRYSSGEGYVGFSQALFLAGARSVVLSLWKVDDMATVLLMDRFYANLLGQREGLSARMGKAGALAEAKNWLKNLSYEQASHEVAGLTSDVARGKGRFERLDPRSPTLPSGIPKRDKPFHHPYYWSAFVLVGDPD